MREILFKAKRKNWEELPIDQWWVEGYIVRPCTCDVDKKPLTYYFNAADERGWYEEVIVLAETVCQYTGLIDKNRNKILENDIVKDDVVFGKVVWDEHYAQFMIDDVHDGHQEYTDFWNEVEVIGNTFDNPKLLEQEDQNEQG